MVSCEMNCPVFNVLATHAKLFLQVCDTVLGKITTELNCLRNNYPSFYLAHLPARNPGTHLFVSSFSEVNWILRN